MESKIFAKPLLEALPSKSGAFYVKRLICNYLEYPFHYHPEFELTYFIKGEGRRYAGNIIEEFSDNDFVLMGGGLPHVWKSAPMYYKNPKLITDCIVIQFSIDCFGKDFFLLNEMTRVNKMLAKAQCGIKFSRSAQKRVLPILKKLVSLEGAQKVAAFLEVLGECAKDKDACYLSPSPMYINEESRDRKRFSGIYAYIIENLHQEITIKEVASLVGLTENSFSRYFKQHTGESFIKFINKLRIETACSLIRAGEKNFTQICFEVGFSSLSYFNRQFKAYKNETPTGYLKNYHAVSS